jgi:flagellin
MSRINTNVSSLIAQTTLGRSNGQLQTALSRLSTGLRINTGKDDPAGLIASENLRRDITAANKAISNTERANQLIATADSSLGQVSDLLNDIRGLVTEAANTGVLSSEQIAANQLQVDSSLEAIDRIAQVTTFQGRKLLDGSLDFTTNVLSGASSVSDLQVDKANLGASGSLAVNVDVTAAASQALITNNAINFTSGAAATGSITFADVTTPASQATGTLTLSNSTGSINITAAAGGQADGTVGNATDVLIQNATNIVQSTGTLTLTNSGGAISVSAVAGGAADGAVGDTYDFVLQDAADIAQASGTLTLTATGGSIDIAAVAGTANDGAAGNVNVVLQTGASTTASYNSGVITIDVAAGATVDDIKNAIDGLAGFSATTNSGGASTYNATDNATQNNVTTGGSDGTGGATVVGTTVTVSRALGDTVSDVAGYINGLADFNATATSGGASTYLATDNATTNNALTGGNNGTTTASYNVGSNLITVNRAIGGTVGQIATAINGLAAFNATAATGSGNTFNAADLGTTNNPLAGGIAAIAGNDAITITSNATGTAFNGTLTFAKSSSVAANGVLVQSTGSNITVTVNDTSTYDVTDLASQIQSQLSGYTVTQTATAGDNSFAAGTDTATTTALAGGTADTGTGLGADLVLKLSGSKGAEVFTFNSGSTLAQVVSAINLISDATGVQATNNSGVLELRSTEYGSDATVDADVVSEGAGGTFAASLSAKHAAGTDIDGTINGYQANGKGNTLSVNTSTLGLSLTVANGSSTDVNFDITGGGAVFQIGPNVVSNQQARIGITSVNSAKLGGTSGRLYELRSGNAKDLSNDPTAAAQVVDQAITKVTSLRGRLGAFQRTTLESNINSLKDTVTNLTQAQSSIRDADFAAESAALTRAQILVQSGTTVLQIANQNPQQVLSLLRG